MQPSYRIVKYRDYDNYAIEKLSEDGRWGYMKFYPTIEEAEKVITERMLKPEIEVIKEFLAKED